MNASDKLVSETFIQLFGEGDTRFDLEEGVITAHGDSRQVLITTDTLHGIYKSLSHETGDAWSVVLKNCGQLWGRKVMTRIEDLLVRELKRSISDVSVLEFCQLVESYLSYHGWGRASIDLRHAASSGVVRISLSNSLMVKALDDVSGTVDYLLAGMFQGVFETISDQKLDCLQVACERTSATNACEFVVSGIKRIDKLEAAGSQDTVDDAIGFLRAA